MLSCSTLKRQLQCLLYYCGSRHRISAGFTVTLVPQKMLDSRLQTLLELLLQLLSREEIVLPPHCLNLQGNSHPQSPNHHVLPPVITFFKVSEDQYFYEHIGMTQGTTMNLPGTCIMWLKPFSRGVAKAAQKGMQQLQVTLPHQPADCLSASFSCSDLLQAHLSFPII